MFGYPSYYDAPTRRYADPRASYSTPSSYDPFGGFGGYSRPPHRPQSHTTFRNPYGYPTRYQEEEEDNSSEEEEEYTQPQHPQRAHPQQQIHLDNPNQHLTPQQRQYLQQVQQQRQRQQQQQQQQQQREQQLRQQQQQHQQKQHQQHRKHKQSTQHPQQTEQHIPIRKSSPVKLREVDMDKEALKIQRKWRGWQVRKHNIIAKLRAINKTESEVDAIVLTPVNQQILGLNPAEPLPVDLDSYYVNHVPRVVLVLEHDLTQKLLALDEISGASEIIRPRRKGLVTKIEGILSRVDAIKRGYAKMTPPPNPTPTISSPDDAPTSSSSSSSSSSVDMPSENKKKESEQEQQKETIPTTTTITEEDPTKSQSSAGGTSSVDIKDVSDSTSVSSSLPSVSSSSSSSSLPSVSASSSSQIPSLKQMCFSLCDSMIKKSLIVR